MMENANTDLLTSGPLTIYKHCLSNKGIKTILQEGFEKKPGWKSNFFANGYQLIDET